jgi:uncharacterized protein Usg
LSGLHERLRGYRLTTAEITYYLPDHPDLLQIYVWQLMDRKPDYPRLKAFLDYWHQHLDAPLHSVRLASSDTIEPARFRHAEGSFSLH